MSNRDLKRAIKMTRNSMMVMTSSRALLKRTSLMQSNKSLLTLQAEMSLQKSQTTPMLTTVESSEGEAAAAAVDVGDDGADGIAPAPAAPVALGEPSDAEVLQMLADSYREITGRAMPSEMTVEQAHAELKMRTIAAWGGDLQLLAAPSMDSMKEESVAAAAAEEEDEERDPDLALAKGFKKARMSLALARKKGAEAVDVSAAPKVADEDWDESMMSMLKASYREVTGHAMPEGMSPARAEAELRRIMIAKWKDEGNADLAEELEGSEGMWSERSGKDKSEGGGGGGGGGAGGIGAAGGAAKRVSKVVDYDEDDEDAEAATPMPTLSEEEQLEKRLEIAANLMVAKDEEVSTFRTKPISAKRMQTGKDVFRAGRVGAVEARSSPKVFEGWLKKKAPGMLKRDRCRWFTLHEDGAMLYYTGPDLANMKGSLNVSSLTADDVAIVGENNKALVSTKKVSDDQFSFTVKTPQRQWQFYCETASQLKAWKKNIVSVICTLNGVPMSTR